MDNIYIYIWSTKKYNLLFFEKLKNEHITFNLKLMSIIVLYIFA